MIMSTVIRNVKEFVPAGRRSRLDRRGQLPGSRCGVSDRKEMEPQNTQNTLNTLRAVGELRGKDDAFDLEAWLAEIEQQTEVQSGGFQVIQALRAMDFVERFGCF